MLQRIADRFEQIEALQIAANGATLGAPYLLEQAQGFPLVFGSERVESWIGYWDVLIVNITAATDKSPLWPGVFGVSVGVNHNTVGKILALGPDDTQVEFAGSAQDDEGKTVVALKVKE